MIKFEGILRMFVTILYIITGLLLIPFVALADPPSEPENITCSTISPRPIVINEIYTGGGANGNLEFIELYTLQDVNLDGWVLKYAGNSIVTFPLSSYATVSADNYIVIDVNQINPNTGEVLLLDADGNSVDYLYYGTTNKRSWIVPSSCGAELPEHEANNQDIARLPNGSGELEDHGNDETLDNPNGGNGSCDTFRDEFSAERYSNQDGSVNWSSDWDEVGDNGLVSSGDIEISGDQLQLEGDGTGTTSLGGPYAQRAADLSSYSSAELSFDYYETGWWESDDKIEIYASTDGGSSWILIHTFSNDQGSSTQRFSKDISAYISDQTRIAFVEKADSSFELFYIDNVQIEACGVAIPTVDLLTTGDSTPILTGTFNSSKAVGGFTVTVNSVTYTLGSSSELSNSGDDWILDLSSALPLPVGVYDVVATVDDGGGSILTDNTVDELTIVAPVCNATFKDEFTTLSYDNNDGDKDFSAGWGVFEGASKTVPEVDPDIESGRVSISGGMLRLTNAPIVTEKQTYPGVERQLDLSLFTSADFSFDFTASGGIDFADSLLVKISSDGGVNWTTLEDITGIGNTSGTKSYDITDYMSSTTRIRLRFNNETDSGSSSCCYAANGETFSIDNVKIFAEGPCGGVDHYELIHDDIGLTCAPETVTIKACITTTTPCPDDELSTEESTITLTVTENATWGSGTINITGATAVQLFDLVEEEVSIGLDGESVVCYENGTINDCTLWFHNTGFVFNVPDLTSCTNSDDVEIKAVRTDDDTQSCVGNVNFINKTTDVNFWSSYINPITGTKSITINNTPIATENPGTSVSLAFDGVATAKIKVTYSDAGKIGLNASYSGSAGTADAGVTLAGNDDFVVVPFGFDVTSLFNNTNDSGVPKLSAGNDFSATVRAVCEDGTNTPNFAATVALTPDSPFNPATGVLGILGNGNLAESEFTDGTKGEATATTLTYNEVGNFTLKALAANYLSSGIDVTGALLVGRFHPHHFNVTANVPQLDPGCVSFTWLDQSVDYATAPVVTISARNKADGVTENYVGSSWWKLTDIVESYTDSVMPATVSIGHSFAGHNPATTAASGTTPGQVEVTFNGPLSWQRPMSGNVAPFNAALKLEFAVNDGEATYINPDDGGSTFRLPIDFSLFYNEILHGRLRLVNAHGSEQLPLSLPIITEYFNGSAFVTNPDDDCTALASDRSEFTFTTSDSISDADNLTAISAGEGALDWTDPPNPLGYVDVGIDLSALPWLQYDWDGDAGGHNEDPPRSRATFGIYKGSETIIYLRETTWR